MNKIFVWVKYGNSSAVKIDATNCQDVNDLRKAVKSELQLPNPPQDISLHATAVDGSVNAEPLRPGLIISKLRATDDENPLFVKVTESMLHYDFDD